MAFVERRLKFTFSGAKSGSFSAEGLRAAANLQAFSGRSGTLAQVKIWGLTMAQMTAYSSPLANVPAGLFSLVPFNLIIEAGDVGGHLSQLTNGQIFDSSVDLSGAPELCFNVSVIGTVYQAAVPIAAQSQPGTQNAEDLIGSLCAAAGLTFNNNGAHAVLRNQATYGSAIDQIDKIADAAQFNWYFDGTTVWLWPRGARRDSTVIPVGPATGMVGYPQFVPGGIVVRSLFNQQIQIGRQMQVTSSIPNAQGLWDIIQVEHELTTMLDGGPWFTTALLAWPGTTTGDSSSD